MHRNLRIALFVVAFVMAIPASLEAQSADVSGELKTWHTVTLTFDGPQTSEDGNPNPFTDYRLMVTFTGPSGQTYEVPGFYAADGNAAETSAKSGNKWRVRFSPDAPGTWRYIASFRQGDNIAVSSDAAAGSPTGFNGVTGSFSVAVTDKQAPDFRAKGHLRYVGEHYLQFAGSKERFIKAGTDSPENFLAYKDFDDTKDTKTKATTGKNIGLFLHEYSPHVSDWRQGDPTWKGDKGKGIIGAINYLSSVGINSIYHITFNVAGGDGGDVWPWTSQNERKRFDVSKLAQWEIVFEHMQSRGIQMHVLTQEEENDQNLDGGNLGNTRKLYYRELVARFAHHPAVVWNLGEENTNSTQQLKDFSRYIKEVDPYDHPIVVHTFKGQYAPYNGLFGFDYFDGASVQSGGIKNGFSVTRDLVSKSAKAGRPWIVTLDEPDHYQYGARPDSQSDHKSQRSVYLWPNLMAGGAGSEWYTGFQSAQSDLDLENFRAFDKLWKQTANARDFYYDNLPFWEMENCDGKSTNGHCFGKEGLVYALYLANGGSSDLTVPEGSYTIQWFNPREGGALQQGSVTAISGPGSPSIGTPPGSGDWVALIKQEGVGDLGQKPQRQTGGTAGTTGTGSSSAGACNLIQRGAQMPQGFAAPYNVLSATQEMLVSVQCSNTSAHLSVGTGNSLQYVYQLGYTWRDNQWQQVILTGANRVANDWYVGSAEGRLPHTATELSQNNFVVAYVCTWTPSTSSGQAGQWKCGCRDQACSTPMWQLQAFSADVSSDGDSAGASTGGTATGNAKATTGGEIPIDEWRRHVIGDKGWRSTHIGAADLDRDGQTDVVTGGYWYKNPGTAGGSWRRHTIGSPLNQYVIHGDFDGDGDIDLFGMEQKLANPPFQGGTIKLHWAENHGSGNFTVRSAGTMGGGFFQGSAFARFKPNGPPEIALSTHNGEGGITGYVFSGGSWQKRQMSPTSQAESLSVNDIDEDGDLDILLGTKWLENQGGAFTTHTLNNARGEPDSHALVDIDDDGDLDAPVGYEGSSKLVWYEQGASPTGIWSEHRIGDERQPMSLDAGDIDGDGDVDVSVGQHDGANEQLVYENVDGSGGQWRRHLVHKGDEHHKGSYLVDIDGDGDLDIISIGWRHNRVLLYENRGR